MSMLCGIIYDGFAEQYGFLVKAMSQEMAD